MPTEYSYQITSRDDEAKKRQEAHTAAMQEFLRLGGVPGNARLAPMGATMGDAKTEWWLLTDWPEWEYRIAVTPHGSGDTTYYEFDDAEECFNFFTSLDDPFVIEHCDGQEEVVDDPLGWLSAQKSLA